MCLYWNGIVRGYVNLIHSNIDNSALQVNSVRVSFGQQEVC